MEKLQIINLSNYIRPEIREVSGKKWVLNGDKNSFYQIIIDAYNGSPTNSAIGLVFLAFSSNIDLRPSINVDLNSSV